MIYRAVRNLLALQDSASTSRVLNLVAIWNQNGTDPNYSAKPFFNSNILNRSIIIKHKLRSNEMDLFGDERSTGTKILVPIDSKDLKLGGQFVFINQKNFETIAQSTFGVSFAGDNRDRAVLDLLDATPSLDPFLLREQMKRFGIYPADCYFEISKADVDRMHNFVAREVNALVSKSFGSGGGNFSKSNKLVSKILSSTADEYLDPLRLNLQMKPSEFSEGLFCWRGFLYYKWCHFSSIPKVNSAMKQMIKYQPAGPMDKETRDNLVKVRASLARNIVKTIGDIEATLKRYDDAYAGLISNNEPQAFRQFLLTAPSMFKELGERLGVVSHIISYWGFRFPVGKEPVIAATEILRIFSDFDENLSFSGFSTEVKW